MKKATFTTRLVAYLLDALIVLSITSIIASGISSKKTEILNNELSQITAKYTEGQITMDEYIKETKDISYKLEKNQITTNIIYVVVSIGYYIVFQYLNSGQTIGKKLMKIKVVNLEDKEPNIIQIIIRTCITNEILTKILIIVFITYMSQKKFMTIYSYINTIAYSFIIISVIMILYSNQKQGLHDKIAKTKVVKEGR